VYLLRRKFRHAEKAWRRWVGDQVVYESECDLAAELEFAGFRGLSYQAKFGIIYVIVNGGVASRSGNQQATHVAGILVMVECVEGIRLDLESEPLGKVELLANTQIPVINARLAQCVPPDGSVRPEWGLGEAGRIDALELRSQIAMNVTARHNIRVHKLAVVRALNIIPHNGVGEAGLEGGNAG